MIRKLEDVETFYDFVLWKSDLFYLFRSVDTKIERARKQKIPSGFIPKTARSVAERWMNQSAGPLLMVSRLVFFCLTCFLESMV
jgi:hypothetical protein